MKVSTNERSNKNIFLFSIKIIKFFLYHLFLTPQYFLLYVYYYFLDTFKINVIFFKKEDFKNELMKGKSLIRLGDGETALLFKRGIWFQSYHPFLRKTLLEMIKNYSTESNYILTLTEKFTNLNNKELKELGVLRMWLPTKIAFNLYFNKKANYGDTHFFYHKENMSWFFNTFLKGKTVILITGEHHIRGLQERNIQGIHFVPTPSFESFSHYEKINNELLKTIKTIGVTSDIRLLFSCGPLGKVLAYQYSKKGYTCYDSGFGLENLWKDEDMRFRT